MWRKEEYVGKGIKAVFSDISAINNNGQGPSRQVRSMGRGGGGGLGGENPLTIHKIYAALTPSDSRSEWAPESAAAKQAENYNIKS